MVRVTCYNCKTTFEKIFHPKELYETIAICPYCCNINSIRGTTQ